MMDLYIVVSELMRAREMLPKVFAVENLKPSAIISKKTSGFRHFQMEDSVVTDKDLVIMFLAFEEDDLLIHKDNVLMRNETKSDIPEED